MGITCLAVPHAARCVRVWTASFNCPRWFRVCQV